MLTAVNEYIIQGIGFVGVALFIISYQIKSNRALFLCQMLGCIVFCLQFFIMGAYTGAIGLIVNIIRMCCCLNRMSGNGQKAGLPYISFFCCWRS